MEQRCHQNEEWKMPGVAVEEVIVSRILSSSRKSYLAQSPKVGLENNIMSREINTSPSSQA